MRLKQKLLRKRSKMPLCLRLRMEMKRTNSYHGLAIDAYIVHDTDEHQVNVFFFCKVITHLLYTNNNRDIQIAALKN